VKNGELDVGVPAEVFFTLSQGKASLGDGTLEVRSSKKSGWLVIEGTLGDITSMQGMPFFGSRFYLELAHTRDMETGRTLIEGQISGSPHDRNPAPFEFDTMSVMILLDRVTKVYGKNGTPALNRISLHVEPREFVIVVGASGAGKSTLLKLLTREEKPKPDDDTAE
jgi:ABC-type multidrug transport system fused ATPase/permease subunit